MAGQRERYTSIHAHKHVHIQRESITRRGENNPRITHDQKNRHILLSNILTDYMFIHMIPSYSQFHVHSLVNAICFSLQAGFKNVKEVPMKALA